MLTFYCWFGCYIVCEFTKVDVHYGQCCWIWHLSC